jgi:hypothetical protein
MVIVTSGLAALTATGCAAAAGPGEQLEDVLGVNPGPGAESKGESRGNATYQGNGNHGLLGALPFGNPSSGESNPTVYADGFRPGLAPAVTGTTK